MGTIEHIGPRVSRDVKSLGNLTVMLVVSLAPSG